MVAFISGISIPGWNYFHPSAEVVETHFFADASKLAYGAALYLRVVHNGEVFVSLQTFKSKVARLKLLSIPRLELSAMHVTSKLAKHYTEKSGFNISSVHLWTDSMDVLFWLQC